MSTLTLISVLCTSTFAAATPAIFDASFDILVTQLSELLPVPGISLAVVHRDGIVSKVDLADLSHLYTHC